MAARSFKPFFCPPAGNRSRDIMIYIRLPPLHVGRQIPAKKEMVQAKKNLHI